jgi:para-nitrobenzyl esterase
MASPLARGLFQKAFGESGSAFGAQYLSKDLQTMRQQRRDGRWVDSLGVRSLAELRALPTEAILQAVKSGNWYFESGIDGKVLTEPIQVTYAAGRQAHVPLLAGWNRDEIASRASSMTAEKWKASSTANFGARTEEFLKFYPGDTDVQARRSAIDYDSDWQPVAPLASIGVSTWEWLEKHRMTGKSPVYCYRMELPAPPSKYHSGSFAFHSDEIEYVFGTLDTRPGAVWRPEDRKLSEQMMSYWTNFAKTGDPNGAGLPHWPRYGENREMIHLDSTVTAGPDAEPSRYEFMLRTMPIDRAYRPGL